MNLRTMVTLRADEIVRENLAFHASFDCCIIP